MLSNHQRDVVTFVKNLLVHDELSGRFQSSFAHTARWYLHGCRKNIEFSCSVVQEIQSLHRINDCRLLF